MPKEVTMYQYTVHYPYSDGWAKRKSELMQKYGQSGCLMPEESGVVDGGELRLYLCKPGVDEATFIVPATFWDYIPESN